MTGAIPLANWLKSNGTDINHLRLQKLLFYCFGAAVAHGYGAELGDIRFRAWKHGPVNLEVYRVHRLDGRAVLPRPPAGDVPGYSAALVQVLEDVLAVYGRLSAWQLREESHGELPWSETPQSLEITSATLRKHFTDKFAPGQVSVPRHLIRAWSFAVDGVPLQRWPNLHSLATALRA